MSLEESDETREYTTAALRQAPIGVIDSGVGGLSILRELHHLMPNEDYVFLADQAHVPYGEKSLAQVRSYTEGITRFLLNEGYKLAGLQLPVKLIVIACNTASAAALHELRRQFPQIKFVGMEPAVKPAAERTRTGVIGVIATAATFQGKLYASLLDRFATTVEVQTRACPEFVALVERGGPYDNGDRAIVASALSPLLETGIDQLVLGCTHFPFLQPLIEEVIAEAGRMVAIVDPSAAVARQARRVLERKEAYRNIAQPGRTVYLTTGDLPKFRSYIQTLLDTRDLPPMQGLDWQAGQQLGLR
ncbi:MAG: glutamate racemase [Chloroflexi bacterium]|nr:glutamate racemase [Chloroflexota bacterium]